MIQVGINKVVIQKVELGSGDKLSLIITLKQIGEVKKSIFEQLESDGEVETGLESNSIRIWPPMVPLTTTKDNKPKTVGEMAKEAADAVAELKNTMIQILSCFTTSDKIKFNLFAGLGLEPESYESMIISEEVLHGIFKNAATQFIEQITPFLDDDELGVRLLLVRQNKKKHYPSIRSRFVKSYPFIEPLLIPDEASKLKFTDYEIKEGLNDGTPLSLDTADNTGEDAVETETQLKNVFG